MAVQERKVRVADVHAWMFFRDTPEQAALRGTVLFWHGLNASKDVQSKELHSLAAEGFLAIGLDNAGHGERRLSDFDQRFDAEPESTFLELVLHSAREAPRIVDELLHRRLALPDRLGAGGISMGGYIVYRALLEERRIRAAAAILGSPQWRLPWPESPHRHPDRFYPTALLSQCAELDQSVLPRFAREFHRQLEPHYAQAPERLRYVEFPGVGHFMPEPAWDQLWDNVLQWFRRFLPG
jgi:alpha-beta hydrolase superfamily lysophospholipase